MKKTTLSAVIAAALIFTSCGCKSRSVGGAPDTYEPQPPTVTATEEATVTEEPSATQEALPPGGTSEAAIYHTTNFGSYRSISPIPTGETFESLCEMMYFNGKQLRLPCAAEDIAASEEGLTLSFKNTDGEELEITTFGQIYRGDKIICGVQADLRDGDIHTVDPQYNAISVNCVSSDEFSLRGNIKPGDDFSLITDWLGEPCHDENFPDYYDYFFQSDGYELRLALKCSDGRLDSILSLALYPDTGWVIGMEQE